MDRRDNRRGLRFYLLSSLLLVGILYLGWDLFKAGENQLKPNEEVISQKDETLGGQTKVKSDEEELRKVREEELRKEREKAQELQAELKLVQTKLSEVEAKLTEANSKPTAPPPTDRAPFTLSDGCRSYPSPLGIDIHQLKPKNPALINYIPEGFPNIFATQAVPFIFSQCESEEVKAIAKQLEKVKPDSKAKCDPETGHCRCPDDLIFDGEDCIDGGYWVNLIETLKSKWEEVPVVREDYLGTCMHRQGYGSWFQMRTAEIDALSDREFANMWTTVSTTDTFTMYYASIFRGKRVLDIGSGFARQTLRFAMYGADVTFLDVSDNNLKLIRRLANIYQLSENVHTYNFTSIPTLKTILDGIDEKFDVICAFGSMHHAPSEFIHDEVQVLTDHLKVGGKWLQLAYPHSMWNIYHFAPFTRFGHGTDVGDGKSAKTPWAEWYHTKKLLSVFHPAKFVETWCGIVTNEFLWMDLTYLGKGDS